MDLSTYVIFKIKNRDNGYFILKKKKINKPKCNNYIIAFFLIFVILFIVCLKFYCNNNG